MGNVHGESILSVMTFDFRKKVVAKYLINAGADVQIQAKNGCTAFDMASLIGKQENIWMSYIYYLLSLANG